MLYSCLDISKGLSTVVFVFLGKKVGSANYFCHSYCRLGLAGIRGGLVAVQSLPTLHPGEKLTMYMTMTANLESS